jgi:hypothetical protein
MKSPLTCLYSYVYIPITSPVEGRQPVAPFWQRRGRRPRARLSQPGTREASGLRPTGNMTRVPGAGWTTGVRPGRQARPEVSEAAEAPHENAAVER